MENEIIVLKKSDLLKALEENNQKLVAKLAKTNYSRRNDISENPKVKRLNTREIKEMLGIGDTTFDKIQDKLPLHRTKTGRMFAYEHDIIAHLFREHPPYFEYSRFWEYISEENLIRHMNER